MISYSQTNTFKPWELEVLRRAEAAVAGFPNEPGLRCHEVARALGKVLDLWVQDGKYGPVEHSWLWTYGAVPGCDRMHPDARILDAYAVGRLPQVQLVHAWRMLPEAASYRWDRFGETRDDIRHDVVAMLEASAVATLGGRFTTGVYP